MKFETQHKIAEYIIKNNGRCELVECSCDDNVDHIQLVDCPLSSYSGYKYGCGINDALRKIAATIWLSNNKPADNLKREQANLDELKLQRAEIDRKISESVIKIENLNDVSAAE